MKHWYLVLLIVVTMPRLQRSAAFSSPILTVSRAFDIHPTDVTSSAAGTALYRYCDVLAQRRRPPRSSELWMCQLMGMNCAALTDFSFSFRGFARRGGDTDVHSDGWGLCFYDGRGLRAFHEQNPCADSTLVEYLQLHPVKSLNVLAHIRFATRGKVELENVHPFQREMWGITWCFAHNGDVSLFDPNRYAGREANGAGVDFPSRPPPATAKTVAATIVGKGEVESRGDAEPSPSNLRCSKIPWIGTSIGLEDRGDRAYNPVGATDSEAIFCAILNALRARFDTLPTLPVLHEALASLCDEIVQKDMGETDGNTILNFLMGCGPHLQFAYSWPGSREGSDVWNGLHYLVREPPFGLAHLSDCDYTIDFDEVTNDDDRVAVIATSPLTDDEEWVEFGRGELILFDEGLPHLAADDCFRVELGGHGLETNAMPRTLTLEEDMRRYVKRSSFFAGADI